MRPRGEGARNRIGQMWTSVEEHVYERSDFMPIRDLRVTVSMLRLGRCTRKDEQKHHLECVGDRASAGAEGHVHDEAEVHPLKSTCE